MRILFVSDVYFPRVNGVSTSIQTFAREFVAEGHQLTLIAPDYDQTDRDPFDIIRIPARRLPLDPEDRLLHARSIRRLSARLARERFDLMHIQTPFVAHCAGIQLARRLHLPVVESYHTFFEEYLDKYAFIFASRTETQGLVLLEAMALGVPVVSTAAMGTREVLREGRGCLIAGDDESDFADKVTRVLEDRRLRAVLSARAKRYAANWSAPLLAQDMLAFYDSVRRRGRIPDR